MITINESILAEINKAHATSKKRSVASNQAKYNDKYEAKKALKLYVNTIMELSKSVSCETSHQRAKQYQQQVSAFFVNDEDIFTMCEILGIYLTPEQTAVIELLDSDYNTEYLFKARKEAEQLHYHNLRKYIRKIISSQLQRYESDYIEPLVTDVLTLAMCEGSAKTVLEVTFGYVAKLCRRVVSEERKGDLLKGQKYTTFDTIAAQDYNITDSYATNPLDEAITVQYLAHCERTIQHAGHHLGTDLAHIDLVECVNYVVSLDNTPQRANLVNGLHTLLAHTENTNEKTIHIIRTLLAQDANLADY